MTISKRVGNLAHLDALKYQIQTRRAAVARLQLQAATGKRIQAPSDDPAAAARAASLKLRLANNQQLVSSVHQAIDWIDASENGLNAAQRILSDARVIALQGANDSQSSESRIALASRVDQLLEELADTSAMRVSGDHIFSGESFDTPPYVLTRDGEDRITGAATNPNIDGKVERLIDQEFRVQVNATPSRVFGVGDPARVDVFQLLIDVRDALMANDGPAVAALLDDLEAAEDQVIGEVAALGSTTVQLQSMLERLDRRQLNTESAISDAEDADLAETLIELQSQEVVLEAALQATARVQRLSLFDFI